MTYIIYTTALCRLLPPERSTQYLTCGCTHNYEFPSKITSYECNFTFRVLYRLFLDFYLPLLLCTVFNTGVSVNVSK